MKQPSVKGFIQSWVDYRNIGGVVKVEERREDKERGRSEMDNSVESGLELLLRLIKPYHDLRTA